MAAITIKGVAPFDGVYPFDGSKFNGTELHVIKEISKVRAGELGEALAAGDYDLVVAFTVIVLRRSGLTVHPDQIFAADVGAITVDLDEDQEVEERPPASASPSGHENEPGDNENSGDSMRLSGAASSNGSEQHPSDPSRIGQPGSATSAISVPATSAI